MLLSMPFVAAAVIFSGCGQTGTVVGQAPQIGVEDNVIMLRVSGGWPDVPFAHMAHAGFQNGECLTCHRHTGISDTTIWSCSSCHSPGDTEGLCLDDSAGHGCWMKQCEKCHLTLPVNPTPNCIDCHV
jgi:hypothetical protein